MLNGKRRAFLRKMANELQPVFQVGKGGVVLSVKRALGIPVKFIGVGEQIDDMRPFDAEEYVKALFENSEE